LIKRDNSTIAIDEPEGWDKQKFVLKRGEYHGVNYEFGLENFDFDGPSAIAIQDEYDAYRFKGKMYLKIDYQCNNGDIENAYLGRLRFEAYEPEYGNVCRVSIPIEDVTPIMMFRNRIDNKVDLQSLVTLDGGAMSAYTGLGVERVMPSKTILLLDGAENKTDNASTFIGNWADGGSPNPYGVMQQAYFVPAFKDNIASEIGGFAYPYDAISAEYEEQIGVTTPPGIPLPYDLLIGGGSNVVDLDRITPIVNYTQELGLVHGTLDNFTLEIYQPNTIINGHKVGGVDVTDGLHCLGLFCCIKRGSNAPVPDDVEWLSTDDSVWGVIIQNVPSTGVLPGATFSKNITIPGLTLYENDRIYLFYMLQYRKKDTNSGDPALDFTYDNGSYFKFSGLNTQPATTAKTFLINEALSRITESITNNDMRVYSDYFGRTDSQPYTTGVSGGDGCGSLAVITKGGFIRQLEAIRANQPPLMAVSFMDMLTGLNPIHNIGFGIEEDSARPGYNRIRVENSGWFYKDGVVFTCDNVNRIKIKVKAEKIYNRIEIGYDKWEAEEFNGIDEFLTKREYRTDVTQVNNTFSQISRFIASGYAYETTRRRNKTSEDWRYDNDIFIICLKRQVGNLVVEQGLIDSPQNIIDPDTIINFRITPARMLLNWLPALLSSYPGADESTEIIFSDGVGNFYASGKQESGFCNTEAGPIAENQNISADLLTDGETRLPYLELEEVSFDYPLSMADWKYIKENRYYEIAYNTTNFSGTGWIDQIQYNANEGIATFILKPKKS
jgi:hypothetical protein